VGRKAPRAPESAPRRSLALSMPHSFRLAKQRSVLGAYVSTERAAATPRRWPFLTGLSALRPWRQFRILLPHVDLRYSESPGSRVALRQRHASGGRPRAGCAGRAGSAGKTAVRDDSSRLSPGGGRCRCNGRGDRVPTRDHRAQGKTISRKCYPSHHFPMSSIGWALSHEMARRQAVDKLLAIRGALGSRPWPNNVKTPAEDPQRAGFPQSSKSTTTSPAAG
jgi:hypothetical protein